MANQFDRRDFLKLAGLGGVVFASRLAGPAFAADTSYGSGSDEFFFVQLSDTHWGFKGKPNPEAENTLKKAVAAVNSLQQQPDFIMFTGDLTHISDDPKERRRRLAEFKEIVAELKVKNVRFMPGEHDASLDRGEAYKEFFGAPNYSFSHKGVNFIVVDNVSDPGGLVGDPQIAWLKGELDKLPADARIVIFTHRPLFDLYPQWDWATRDGAKVMDVLMPHQNVTVFYGHIHQEHHQMTGHIAHHAAKGLMFPLPIAGSQPKRDPVPWDPAEPFKGLGFREVEAEVKPAKYEITELPVVRKA
jgi:hypothetical protein